MEIICLKEKNLAENVYICSQKAARTGGASATDDKPRAIKLV